MAVWIRLHHVLKTKQLYQAINLLDEYHIRVKTLPDEFSGTVGCKKLLLMDPDKTWPLFVKRKHLSQAISILTEHHLLPILDNTLIHK